MNSEEPYREQAERTKRSIQKLTDTGEYDQLPPRARLHRRKKNKRKRKLKYPLIRFLVLVFILLPIIIFTLISHYNGKKVQPTDKTNPSNVGYETIHLEQSNDEGGIRVDKQKQKVKNQEKSNSQVP